MEARVNQLLRYSFNEIYTTYYKKSFYFAKSYVHENVIAEDIVSESMIRLWEKLKELPMERTEVPLYLMKILKNKCLDYLKHEQVRRNAHEEIIAWQQRELDLRLTSLEACCPDEIFSVEIEAIIHQTLLSLHEQTRKIFILSRFEQKSNQEIADEMGITVKGVEYHITKALKALRIGLKDYLPLFYFLLYNYK